MNSLNIHRMYHAFPSWGFPFPLAHKSHRFFPALDRNIRRHATGEAQSTLAHRNIQVVLVNPNTPGNYRKAKIATANYGLSMLSGFVKTYNQAEVTIIDGRYEVLTPSQAFEKLGPNPPDIVGASLLVDESVKWTNELFSLIKHHFPTTHITLGSYFPSLLPREAFEMVPLADSIIAGEGEVSLSALIEKIKMGVAWNTTKGLYYRSPARTSHQTLGKLGTSAFPNIPSNSFGNVFKHSLQELLEISKKQSVQSSSRAGEKYGLDNEEKPVIKNGPQAVINDLDQLPYPDRYMAQGNGSEMEAMIEGTRGCSFKCSFCAVNDFDKLSTGAPKRLRSAQSLVAEIMDLLSRYPSLQGVRFVDSDFILPGSERRAKEFADLLIEKGSPIRFMFDLRAPSVVKMEDLVKRLHQAGLQRIYMGIESGSDDILKKMRKASSAKFNQEAGRILNTIGVDYSYGFMMITPWTFDHHIEENIGMLKKLGKIEFRSLFHEMTLIPGTHAFREGEKLGNLTWRGSLSYYTYKTQSTRVEKFRQIGALLQRHYPQCFGQAGGYIYESNRQLYRTEQYDKARYFEGQSDALFLDILNICWQYTEKSNMTEENDRDFVDSMYQIFSLKFDKLLREIEPSVNLTNCDQKIPNFAPRLQI